MSFTCGMAAAIDVSTAVEFRGGGSGGSRVRG
jgi:hypothetical protein